jgi:hypothetical protein
MVLKQPDQTDLSVFRPVPLAGLWAHQNVQDFRYSRRFQAVFSKIGQPGNGSMALPLLILVDMHLSRRRRTV